MDNEYTNTKGEGFRRALSFIILTLLILACSVSLLSVTGGVLHVVIGTIEEGAGTDTTLLNSITFITQFVGISYGLTVAAILMPLTRRRDGRYRGYLSLTPLSIRQMLRWSLYVVVLSFLFVALTVVTNQLEQPNGWNYLLGRIRSPWALGIVACISLPIGDELLFRGFLFQGLDSAVGTNSATIVSAITWAMTWYSSYVFSGDIFDWVGIAYAVTFGAIFSIARRDSGSTYLPMFLHALANVIGFGAFMVLGV